MRHFAAQEVIDPITYARHGDEAVVMYMDHRLMLFIDWLWEKLDSNGYKRGKTSIIINNYKWGGPRKWSGTRLPESEWYSDWSAHSWGKGVDMQIAHWEPLHIHKLIKAHWEEIKRETGLTGLRLEHSDCTANWVHADTMHDDGLYIFRPY